MVEKKIVVSKNQFPGILPQANHYHLGFDRIFIILYFFGTPDPLLHAMYSEKLIFTQIVIIQSICTIYCLIAVFVMPTKFQIGILGAGIHKIMKS